MRKATNQHDNQTISLLLLPFCCSMVVTWPVLMSWSCLRGRDEVIWLVVRWRGEYYWLVATCHVIWCDVIACLVSRHVMQVMSCFSLRCHWLWGPLCGLKWFCEDVVIQSTTLYYKVLQRTTPALQSTTPVLLQYLLRTTKYCSSTTMYYKVLRQYYSVLQTTTPVLLCNYNMLLQYSCTTTYYSSTTLYYSTTKYYSSATLHYKALLQYSVLQTTTPVLLCATKF